MKASFCKQHQKWRLIIPPRITGTGKRQLRFFDSKEMAEAKAREITREGLDPAKDISSDKIALLRLIEKEFGGNAAAVIENLRFAQKTIGNISEEKRINLEKACEAFVERQINQGKNRRTIYSDRQALKYLCGFAGNQLPLVELTETRINEYFDTMKAGGRRRTQYSRVKKFLNWCVETGYLAINPMAKIKPREGWKSNKGTIKVETFRRILSVCAGLQPMQAGEPVTTKFLRLLPYYVLGGLEGMRRCELIDSNAAEPVIEWTDIDWRKDQIKIRDEVAKQTKALDRRRWIPLEPAAKAWLSMVRKDSGRILDISQSTLQRLNDELMDGLKAERIEIPENGLRNSYASYGAACRSPGEVAKAMGDLESTIIRCYVQKGFNATDGLAWFAIRPEEPANVIKMAAA